VRMRSTWAWNSCNGILLVYLMPPCLDVSCRVEREVADLAERREGLFEVVVLADRQNDHAIRMQVLPRDAQQVSLVSFTTLSGSVPGSPWAARSIRAP